MRRVALILVLALAIVAAGCGDSSDDVSGTTTAATETSTTATTSTTKITSCQDVEAPAARADGGAKEPTERLDPEKTYELVFDTSCGSFTVLLDLDSAPATAASLVSLANAGFYDDTIFHRVAPGFVIQGGDPTQQGSGGPGYSTVDPPAAGAKYVEGVVAMAKTQTEAAGTSGSQFFVVSGPDAATLPPDYAIVGKVTSGMDTVKRIDALGDPTTQTPSKPVVINKVTVQEQ